MMSDGRQRQARGEAAVRRQTLVVRAAQPGSRRKLGSRATDVGLPWLSGWRESIRAALRMQPSLAGRARAGRRMQQAVVLDAARRCRPHRRSSCLVRRRQLRQRRGPVHDELLAARPRWAPFGRPSASSSPLQHVRPLTAIISRATLRYCLPPCHSRPSPSRRTGRPHSPLSPFGPAGRSPLAPAHVRKRPLQARRPATSLLPPTLCFLTQDAVIAIITALRAHWTAASRTSSSSRRDLSRPSPASPLPDPARRTQPPWASDLKPKKPTKHGSAAPPRILRSSQLALAPGLCLRRAARLRTAPAAPSGRRTARRRATLSRQPRSSVPTPSTLPHPPR